MKTFFLCLLFALVSCDKDNSPSYQKKAPSLYTVDEETMINMSLTQTSRLCDLSENDSLISSEISKKDQKLSNAMYEFSLLKDSDQSGNNDILNYATQLKALLFMDSTVVNEDSINKWHDSNKNLESKVESSPRLEKCHDMITADGELKETLIQALRTNDSAQFELAKILSKSQKVLMSVLKTGLKEQRLLILTLQEEHGIEDFKAEDFNEKVQILSQKGFQQGNVIDDSLTEDFKQLSEASISDTAFFLSDVPKDTKTFQIIAYRRTLDLIEAIELKLKNL